MTQKNQRNTLALTSLALLAQAAPALASEMNAPRTPVATVNVASVEAIRASWIKVSPMCKDRSFPFVAVKTAPAPSPLMDTLFAELDAAAGVQG